MSSCVVFKNAKPAKRDYRHFNVKTVEGPNDFASMEEVVFRRYKRLLAEGASLPQLVIIDGGKGQLSAAMKGVKAFNWRAGDGGGHRQAAGRNLFPRRSHTRAHQQKI